MIASTPDEIEKLREGGRRLVKHVRMLSEMVGVGVKVSDLEAAAQKMVKEDGDELAFYKHREAKNEKPYPSGLCVSVNEIFVHGPASENTSRLKDGDVVSLDFGIKHAGFFTDHAVTVIVGDGKPAHVRLVNATKEALDVGIAAAKAGGMTGDIGYAVQQIADTYGFGYPRNLCGHGVGKKVHEEPHVPNFGAAGSGEKMPENLVIAIEPMFAIGTGAVVLDSDGFSYRTKDGGISAHFEHTVLVTKNGAEILTKE